MVAGKETYPRTSLSCTWLVPEKKLAAGLKAKLIERLRKFSHEVESLVLCPALTAAVAGERRSIFDAQKCFPGMGINAVDQVDNHVAGGAGGEGVAVKPGMGGCGQFDFDCVVLQDHAVITGFGFLIRMLKA